MKALFAVVMMMVLLPASVFAVEADKTVEYEGGTLGKVAFSGSAHSSIQCGECHSRIFRESRNSFRMTSRDHIKGNFCAACHDGTRAFGTRDVNSCDRCHQRN